MCKQDVSSYFFPFVLFFVILVFRLEQGDWKEKINFVLGQLLTSQVLTLATIEASYTSLITALKFKVNTFFSLSKYSFSISLIFMSTSLHFSLFYKVKLSIMWFMDQKICTGVLLLISISQPLPHLIYIYRHIKYIKYTDI